MLTTTLDPKEQPNHGAKGRASNVSIPNEGLGLRPLQRPKFDTPQKMGSGLAGKVDEQSDGWVSD